MKITLNIIPVLFFGICILTACTQGRKNKEEIRRSGIATSPGEPEGISGFSERLSPVGRILATEDLHVWGCSPIYGPDGKVHVFFSCWKGEHKNWLTDSEIGHAIADYPEGPYRIVGTVLEGRGEDYWDAHTVHNPTIQKVGDKYALFYIGNNLTVAERNGESHASTQRIGLALADDLNGPFIRAGKDGLILDVSSYKKDWDSYLTTNPALLKHPDGNYWLYYKAWDRNNDGMRKMGVAFSDRIEGPYQKYRNNPIVDFSAMNKQVEDAYVWIEGDRFHMIMRDMGVIDDRVGLYLSSSNGLRWSEPSIGYERNTVYFPDEDLGRFERPQVLMRDGLPEYLFLALQGGKFGTSTGAVLKISRRQGTVSP